ncbi:hypothetical protein [Blastochloris viridis]|uniref:Uncharacterized protein n=1 Tax=Blastochloris viridis TaxID=1079 RepID=A0A0H5B668_BLAVI|nr:hypothetical protein [Blastochloris viridis]ALK08942.1 hypothetical protein BVIR_1153 [Blastochloris viridis]BAR97660.1 hypothetical protein BV133_67 [Blastochloris viridis]CUU41603.1 hypothetical protein BVIRIDIS_05960 [Blastochloris viridis]
MSNDDVFTGLLHSVRRAGHLFDEMMEERPATLLPGRGFVDRNTLASRSFWTGAALGAAAVLTLAAVVGRRDGDRSPAAETPTQGGS